MTDDPLNPGQRVRATLSTLPGRVKTEVGALLGIDASWLPDALPPTPYRAILSPSLRPFASGEFGVAWRGSLPKTPPRPDQQATLGAFLLDLPGYLHRWWRHYLAFVIHLREIEGVPTAHRQRPDRTHELMVLALDPEPPPDPTNFETWRWATTETIMRAIERDRNPTNRVELTFPEFSAARAGGQLTLPDDAAAVALLERVVRALCSGDLTPERADFPGGLSAWCAAVEAMA
jgi:hypothetical protein